MDVHIVRLKVIPDYLSRPVDKIDMSVQCLAGKLTLRTPICVAPMGILKIAHPDAELAIAKGLQQLEICSIYIRPKT